MTQTEAGGQKTQNPSRGISSLEDNLEQVTRAIGECFEAARTIPRHEDEYGHLRHSEYSNAVALLKASAKIGRTLAQIQGGKFDHNISVTRQLKPSAPPRRVRVQKNLQSKQPVALSPPPPILEGSNG